VKTLALAVILSVALAVSGCNGVEQATRVENVVNGLIALAQAEVSVVPPQDRAAFAHYVALAQSLDAQLDTCIKGVSGVMGKGGKFLACFNAFAVGLTNPAELAQLRLMSPGAQHRVQLYATAIITGVNVAVAYFGGVKVSPPPITQAPTAADLHSLAVRVGIRGY